MNETQTQDLKLTTNELLAVGAVLGAQKLYQLSETDAKHIFNAYCKIKEIIRGNIQS